MDSASPEQTAAETSPRPTARPDLEDDTMDDEVRGAKPPARPDSTRSIQTPQARTASSRRQAILESLADVVRQAVRAGRTRTLPSRPDGGRRSECERCPRGRLCTRRLAGSGCCDGGTSRGSPDARSGGRESYQTLATSDRGRLRAAALIALARASAPAPDWLAVQAAAAALDQALTSARGGTRPLTAGVRGALQAAARGALEGAEAKDPLAVRLAAEVVLASLPTDRP